MSEILIRDSEGVVFNRVTNPTAIFDKSTGTLHKIGELGHVQKKYSEMQERYRRAGLESIADDLTLVELPKDQELVDKVFNISGYIKVLYKEELANA